MKKHRPSIRRHRQQRRNRTRPNVWRLHLAVDLHRDDQIAAFYEDGVGTQEFLPLKVIGGAFGWGLKRNVLDLYEFLCRNYEDGDKIVLFGFSRGAFTMRLLAWMIRSQGVRTEPPTNLRRIARELFNAYRVSSSRGWLTSVSVVALPRSPKRPRAAWSCPGFVDSLRLESIQRTWDHLNRQRPRAIAS